MKRLIKNNYYPTAILDDIDTAFSIFSQDEEGIGSLKNSLLEKNQFYQAFTEISIASRLKKKFDVKLQPKIDSKRKSDIKFSIQNQDYLMEIYTPKRHFKPEYAKGAIQMENKVREVILKKINNQLSPLMGSKLMLWI